MITINQAECVGCGACVERCPRGALTLADSCAQIDRKRCDGCGLCVEVCPAGAITRMEPVVAPAREIVFARAAQPAQPGRLAAVGTALVTVGAQILPYLLDLLSDQLAHRLAPQPRAQFGGYRPGMHRRQRARRGPRNRHMRT